MEGLDWRVAAILAVAFLASLLTLFSGFGLGTLLLPAFALAFPLEVAIAATAVVHLANNLAKGALLGRAAHGPTVLRFGIPATLAAVAGAGVLLLLEGGPAWRYDLGGPRAVTPIGLTVGLLVVAFALLDLVPALRRLQAGKRHLVAGGLLSGFFGGLSGHQGALRSVFLAKLGLSPRAFVATGVMCAIFVDVARLAVYSGRHASDAASITAAGGWGVLAGAVLMAFAGAFLGARLLPHATVAGVRILVGALLLAMGPLIALGLV
ncbi:MAG: uncharacterized protein QOD77_203 [Thermoplasmata archaeon]|nr:uncharacterized protein [Thermoplasmata archaeon]